MNIDSENSCVICLDNNDRDIKIFFCTYKDKLKKINCKCNFYCHTSCINQNVFEYNEGRQNCIICNKEYNPNYENNNFEIIFENRSLLKKIIENIIKAYNYFLSQLKYLLLLLMFLLSIYVFYNYKKKYNLA